MKSIELFAGAGGLAAAHQVALAVKTKTKMDKAKAKVTKPKKVEWFGAIYDRMRKGIVRHAYHVRAEQLNELRGMNFVLLAIDDPKAKKVIVDFLLAEKIPFIDVGMDVSLDRDVSLRGQVRVTVGTPVVNDHIEQVVSFADGPENNIYRNIHVEKLRK